MMSSDRASGHRVRLRQRFIAGGPRAFLDHEIIEMLLAHVVPRGDTKRLGYALIDATNSARITSAKRPTLGRDVAAVMRQPLQLLADGSVKGFGGAMAVHLEAVKEAAVRIASTSSSDAPILGSWNAVGNFCRRKFATQSEAALYVLLLDYKHRLLAEPVRFPVDMDADQVARATMVAALRHAASGLIVVRLDPEEAPAGGHRDHALAQRIRDAGAPAAVLMHDFIVVAGDSFMSMRSMGVLEVATAYETVDLHDAASRNGWYADPEEALAKLQETVAAGNVGNLHEIELLALLLRRATKDAERARVAEDLIARFGNMGRVLSAPIDELIHVFETLPEAYRPDNAALAAVQLAVIGEATQRILRAHILGEPLADMAALVRYCRVALAYGEVEHLHALFLNRERRLLWDEVLSRGTVNTAPVQPREIASRALRLGAAFVVLVHNHPTGDPEPSQADVSMTLQVDMACRSIGVQVLDHLIVAVSGHVSLAEEGRMPRPIGEIATAEAKAAQRPKAPYAKRKRPAAKSKRAAE